MMSLTCHVTYKNKKKILKGETSGEIMDNIKSTFEISCDIAVQRYSIDFEDWVDVEVTEIEDKCKLNVIEQQTKSTVDRDEPEGDPQLTGDTDVPDIQAMEMVMATKKLQRQQAGSNDEESIQVADVKSSEGEKNSSIKQRAVKLSSWPVPFKLPSDKYRPNLKAALSESMPLQYAEKQCLLDVLYDEITKCTFRPSPQHYQEVVTTVLRAYPWLKNGLLGRDAVDYWKKSLSNKFRNERKRHERDNPLAQPPKKTKSSAQSQDKATKPQGKSLFGIKSYLPPRPEGEDDETIAEHINILKGEAKKKRQDLGLIQELMTITLADRRVQIVTKNWTVKQIKEQYPCLFDEDEMFAEFQRLTEVHIHPRMEGGLVKYGDAILNSGSKVGETVKEEVQALCSLTLCDETKKRIRSYGVLILLPQLLGEKLDTLVSPQSKKRESPNAHIKHTAEDNRFTHLLDDEVKYSLVTEGEVVCTTSDLVSAFGLLVCIHYAFNLMYDKKVNNTMSFIQKVLLNIVDQTGTPSRVVRFLYDLNTILTNTRKERSTSEQ